MVTLAPLRIGLISDTHEVDEPIRLAEELTRLDCDFYVHLGDVGGCHEITRAVRQYKQYPESVTDLPDEQYRTFQANLERGLPALRAYLDAVIGQTPAHRLARLSETRGNYEGIVRRLAELSDVLCISGNTDRLLMSRAEQLMAPFLETGLEFLRWPAYRDLAGRLLVFWPSLGRDQVADPSLTEFIDEVLVVARRYDTIAILAHEQLFKGPAPETYRRNALQRGYRPLTVPHHEPNLSWRHLIRLLQGLPRTAQIVYLHGHVHDANEVLGAGAPYLRRLPDGALSYRVPGGDKHPGRRIPSYSVPIGHLAHLTLGDGAAEFRAWLPEAVNV